MPYQVFQQAVGNRTVAVSFNATSAATALPTRVDGDVASILHLQADQDFRVSFGPNTATATPSGSPRSIKLAKNTRHVIGVPRGATHIAVVRDTADGTLEMTPGEN